MYVIFSFKKKTKESQLKRLMTYQASGFVWPPSKNAAIADEAAGGTSTSLNVAVLSSVRINGSR